MDARTQQEGEDEEETSLEKFQELIRNWEQEHSNNGYDPTPTLEKMAELLEKETHIYYASDPDPFEERHPCRVDPECQLGQILKAYFKKESLVSEVFSNYMRENYFTRQGLDQSSFSLNVAACRVVLDILPGLEVAVLNETDGLVTQLYKWISAKHEPLTSYAIGLLALAMELNEVATDAEIREKNSKLVPELLTKLKEMQEVADQERIGVAGERFKRPFALFSKSPNKVPRRSSTDNLEMEGVTKLGNSGLEHGDSQELNGFGTKVTSGAKRSLDRSGGLAPGWPGGLMSPPRGQDTCPQQPRVPLSAENSNSSWAEMELDVIGHFDVFPLTSQASQIFILRLLTPLAEYQDFLALTQGTKILEILEKYINVRESKDARLAFEALRLLASLFCHKKFTLEWISRGGLNLLMHLPRPSLAATGSSLCLYYLACDDDTMEKICCLPHNTLRDLVRYCLWLLECSHETGRQYSIMFFGLAFPFRNIMQIFDANDGLRRLYNTISTLSIISDKYEDRSSMTDDEEFMQRQIVRYTVQAIKKYLEAHLAVKVDDEVNRDLRRDGCSPQPPHPQYKPHRLEADQVSENIFTLLELMNYRSRWDPIDQLIKLGGITTLLQVVAMTFDTQNHWPGRAETVRSCLDVLSVCCVSPKVQLMLCDKFELPEESVVGISMILGAADGEIVPESAEVQKAALQVLCFLLCGPIVRPGCVKNTPRSRQSKTGVRTSDEIINKVWECVRENNGIMTLLQLIQTKTPLTDADSIRALACKALVGLARSSTATQIMSKLSIFNNGVLNMLLREPVLQDRRAEHVKFQKHAHELMEKVSGPMKRKNYDNNDITLDMLHRASVVANTRIRYNDKQLFQMIHEHLVMCGLFKTAETLRHEVDIVPLVDTAQFSGGPPVYPARSMISFHPSHLNRRIAQNTATPARIGNVNTQGRQQPRQLTISSNRSSTTPSSSRLSSSTTPTPASRQSNPSNPIQIRVNRPISQAAPVTPLARSAMKSTLDAGDVASNKSVDVTEDRGHEVSLVSIVSDYLAGQHALCKNPMTTCPEFDLFLPHKCPDPRSRRDAPLNFTARYSRKSLFPPYGGPDGRKLNRKLVYSRFRPVKSFRAGGDDRDENVLTTAAFSTDKQFLYAGTVLGDVKMFNLATGEENTYQCHESLINSIQPGKNNLVITSTSWRLPYSKIWTIGEFFEEKMKFKDEEHLEFSKLVQDKVVGTCAEGVATIWDLNTAQLIRTLTPTNSNMYLRNKATFDPTDDLILCDGVLWDYRVPKQIHKFDKLNQSLSGVFHPNGLEIISNTEVWDIRTFHLLRTVPQLDQSQVMFNTEGDVIFGVNLEQELEEETKYETSFKTFDAGDYSLIATIETKKSVLNVCPSWDDCQLAVIEQDTMERGESVVRLYDIGRLRAEEDDQEEEDEDRNDDDDDSDNSDDGDIDQDDDYASGSENDPDDEDDDILDALNAVSDEDDDMSNNGDEDNGDDNDSWEDLDVQEENL